MKSNGRGSYTMGEKETKTWQSSGPDGYAFRKEVGRRLQAIADKRRKNIELYASARSGGWMAEQYTPDRDSSLEGVQARRSNLRGA